MENVQVSSHRLRSSQTDSRLRILENGNNLCHLGIKTARPISPPDLVFQREGNAESLRLTKQAQSRRGSIIERLLEEAPTLMEWTLKWAQCQRGLAATVQASNEDGSMENRHRIRAFRDILFASTCCVLEGGKLGAETVDQMLQARFAQNKERAQKKYLQSIKRGAHFVNSLIRKLGCEGWGSRALEVVFFCNPFQACYRLH